MKIENLHGLFELELRYAYDCEQKLVKKGLPGMIEAASAPQLRSALEQHLEETRVQVSRLERVFSLIQSKAGAKENDILDELADAAEDLIDSSDQPALRDAAIVLCANKVEHYEIALYGSLVSFATHLGLREAASLLQETLDEEKAADGKLTQLAETIINAQAAQEPRAA